VRWLTLVVPPALLLAAAGGIGLAAPSAAAPSQSAPSQSAQSNVLTNGDFAAGSTTGWTCSPGDTVASSPTAPGSSYVLAGTPTSSDDAQCSQAVSVQPSSSYTLTGSVEGAYVYLGDSGTGTSTTVTGLAASTTYSFAVTADNSAGESPRSAEVSATTASAGGGGNGTGGAAACPLTC
jgi:hypothetical protein